MTNLEHLYTNPKNLNLYLIKGSCENASVKVIKKKDFQSEIGEVE